MSKFKAGDLVRVTAPIDRFDGPGWAVSMNHLDSAVVKVEEPFDKHGGKHCFSSGEWTIADDWAEIVSPSADLTTLTRRDHFAMAALTGLLSNGLVRNMDGPSDVSGLAYELADAMEAARNKEGAE